MALMALRLLAASRHASRCCIRSTALCRSFPQVRMAHVPATNEKVCLVVGGNGALGQAVVNKFRSKGWIVVSADKTENVAASSNVVLEGDDLKQQVAAMKVSLSNVPGGKAHAIVCAAGGWAGGNASSDGLLDSLTSMSTVCLQPVFSTAAVAGTHLEHGGVLVLTGAAAAIGPTPGMLAYGAVKAATHHVAVSLSSPDGGLPAGSRVYAVLPRMIDTPSNRKWVTGGDTSTWTPPADIAEKIAAWAEGGQGVPSSGTLHEVVTQAGSSTWQEHAPLYAAQLK